MLYRHKAPIVEAQQIDVARNEWPPEVLRLDNLAPCLTGRVGMVQVAHARVYVWNHDWILRHADGSVTVCKRDVFRANYEADGQHLDVARWREEVRKLRSEIATLTAMLARHQPTPAAADAALVHIA